MHDDHAGDGLQHAGGQALDHPHRQHQAQVGRKAADQAAAAQQRQHQRVATAVAQPPQQPGRGQHRHRHRAHEAGGQPLRILLAQRELAADRRHRHVDGGGGHQRGHVADHHRDQHPPAVVRAMAGLQRGQRIGAGGGRRRALVRALRFRRLGLLCPLAHRRHAPTGGNGWPAASAASTASVSCPSVGALRRCPPGVRDSLGTMPGTASTLPSASLTVCSMPRAW